MIGVAFPTWGRRQDVSRDRCKQKCLVLLPKRQLSISLQHCSMGLPELPGSPHQQQNRGVAEVSFRDRASVPYIYIYLLGLPGENVLWNRRIITDRLELLDHRFWGR